MSKSLYNGEDKRFSYTREAIALEAECHKCLYPIITKWMKEGYSPREICGIIMALIPLIMSEIILSLRFDDKKD